MQAQLDIEKKNKELVETLKKRVLEMVSKLKLD